MAGHYIVAGLELFKRSQMAIFDKALSMVDLFDSAVSDSFVTMQDIYPHPFYEFEQEPHSNWDRFLLLLEGCYRHIRLYFTFTIAMICCTVLMLRRRKKRRRMFAKDGRIIHRESPKKPPGGNNCKSEKIKSEYLHEIPLISVIEKNQNTITEKTDASQMSKEEENSAITTDTATRAMKEMKQIEEKLELNKKDSIQVPSIDEKVCSQEPKSGDILTSKSKHRKTKKPRGGSLAFEEKTTISNTVPFIPAKKLSTAAHQRTSDKGRPSVMKFPKSAKNKLICATQKKGSGKKKAQIFILLGDVAKERRLQISPKSKSGSPSKHFQDTQSTTSSPKKRNSPLTIKKLSLRERKPFNGRGPLSRCHEDTQTNSISERQKLQANIPYLHTLSPRRRLPSKAVPQKNKQSTGKQKSKNPQTDDRKPITGFYLSPNTRMAMGESTKINSKYSKEEIVSPNKRCKSCKKIRQYPEDMPETKLLQIRKKAKSNIGSLFCFSPETKLPAPFCNARMNSNIDNLLYSRTPCYRAASDQLNHCVEDTNMNKAVLKLELQNNNPNNHKKADSRFTIGENSFHSSTIKNERFNEAMRYKMDSKRHPDCAPCRIQHNVYPTDVNEMRMNSVMYQEDVESEVCHKEGIRHGQTHRISNIFRQSRTQRVDHRRTLGSDEHLARVQDSTASVCNRGNPNAGPFFLSRMKNLNAFDTNFDEGLDECRKSKGRHCRESRRRWPRESYSNKASDPFCSPCECVGENHATTADNSTMCGRNGDVLNGTQPKCESEYNHVEEEVFDVPRHCDKIRSLKWRHRHEPYKWASTKTQSTREDPSLAAITHDASSTRISDTPVDKKPHAHSHVLAITDLSQLAQFTVSTESSKDASSSDVDPCRFSVRSTTSYQNKNNCSPSRLTKPFIKPTTGNLVHPTIDQKKSGSVNGHEQIIGAGSQSAGSKDTFNSCLNWQEGSDESKQENTFSMDSGLTNPRVPTGEGHRLMERPSPQTQLTEDPVKRPIKFISSPHSDTKLGSVRKASVATQNFYYRPRNKSLRQHKLFKYPSIARKVVMRAIGQHAPTYSLSGNYGVHRHSVTLGVQTSHTSLRHIAVQTSPQERRRPCRRIPVRIHHQTNPRPEIVNTEVRDEDDTQEEQLDKTQGNFSPVKKLFFENSQEVINHQTSNGILRDLEEADTFVSSCLKDEYANDVTGGNGSEKDSSFHDPADSSLISNNTHDIDVTSETKNNELDSTDTGSGNDLKPFIVPIRRQSLPILSLSMTTDDVKSDVMASPSRNNSPSNTLLDVDSSKEWLTRPKWENANEEEVNRRVERALKLRQELQKCRIDKASISPQRMFRPSLFGQEREDVLFDKASTSTFKAKHFRGASVNRQAAKDAETKRNITSSFKTSVRIENPQSTVKRDDTPSITGTVPVRRVESSTTDTLVKTFPFVARQAESCISENTSPGKRYKMSTKHGDVAIETDSTSDTPEQSHQSHKHGAAVAGAVPVPESTEVRPSSATSLSQNTTDSFKLDENYDNESKRVYHQHHQQQQHQQHQHHAHPQLRPVTKNSPPIKISKMENVIQTEYPKLVGELVQALPHVPLASFVEWFIETSNPGQFLSSDESISTAADVKEVAKETVNNASSTLESTGNDASVIYIRRDTKDDDYVDNKNESPDENEQQRDKLIMTPSMSQSSPDIFNLPLAYQSIPSINNASHIETEAEVRHGDTPIPDEDPEGNVASIRRILLTRKDSSNESLDIPTDNRRRIITLRQTSNASPFEGNLPSHQ